MPLRVAAQERLDCEPLLTLGNQREYPLDTPALFQLWGIEYERDGYTVRMGSRFWLTAKG